MRLLKTKLILQDLEPHTQNITSRIRALIPSESQEGSMLNLTHQQMDEIMKTGMQWMVRHGYGTTEDLKNTESERRLPENNPDKISDEAITTAIEKFGTIGEGEHSIELNYIEQIIDPKLADDLGLTKEQIIITIRKEEASSESNFLHYALAGRQLITHQIRLGFEDLFGSAKGHIEIIYDAPTELKCVKIKPIATIK